MVKKRQIAIGASALAMAAGTPAVAMGSAGAEPLNGSLAAPSTPQPQDSPPGGPSGAEPQIVRPDTGATVRDRANLADRPPSCVYVDVFPASGLLPELAQVGNYCPTTQRVKVIVAFYWDSECFQIYPNEYAGYEFDRIGRFDGLEAC